MAMRKPAARRRRDVFLGDRSSAADRAVPRDNVVFEAGCFSGLKGKQQVPIVREEGAKMPADLGGDLFAALPARDDIAAVRPVLERFVEAL